MASAEVSTQFDVVAPDIMLHVTSHQFSYTTIKIAYAALRDEEHRCGFSVKIKRRAHEDKPEGAISDNMRQEYMKRYDCVCACTDTLNVKSSEPRQKKARSRLKNVCVKFKLET